jgi:hypothetical protein
MIEDEGILFEKDWEQEQKDIEVTLLRTIIDEYGIHPHGQELFLSNRPSLECAGNCRRNISRDQVLSTTE